jgi:hypothetical protein
VNDAAIMAPLTEIFIVVSFILGGIAAEVVLDSWQ